MNKSIEFMINTLKEEYDIAVTENDLIDFNLTGSESEKELIDFCLDIVDEEVCNKAEARMQADYGDDQSDDQNFMNL